MEVALSTWAEGREEPNLVMVSPIRIAVCVPVCLVPCMRVACVARKREPTQSGALASSPRVTSML